MKLTHNQISASLTHIKSGAKYVIRDLTIEWLDENQTEPTKAEIEAGWVAYQAAEKTEAKATAEAKAALLERLGITEDEAKLLLS
jgi:hypothetical protein